MIYTPYGDRVVVGSESELIKPAMAEMLDAVLNPDHHLEFEFAAFDNLTTEQKILVLSMIAQAMFDSRVAPPPRTAVFDASIASIFATIGVLTEIEVTMNRNDTADGSLQSLDSEGDETTGIDYIFWRSRILDAHYHQVRLANESANLPQDSSRHDDFEPNEDGVPDFVKIDPPQELLENQNESPIAKRDNGFDLLKSVFTNDQDPDDETSPDDEVPSRDSLDLSEWEFLIECIQDSVLFDRDFQFDGQLPDGDPDQSTGLRMFLGVDEDYFTAIAPDTASEAQIYEVLEQLEKLLEPHFKLRYREDS